MRVPVCWWQCAVMFGKLQGKASIVEHWTLLPMLTTLEQQGQWWNGTVQFRHNQVYPIQFILPTSYIPCRAHIRMPKWSYGELQLFCNCRKYWRKKNIWVLLFPRVLEMVLECVYCQTRVAEVTLSKMWPTLFLIFTIHTGQISNWSYEQLQKPQIQRWQNCTVIIEY